MSAAWRVSNYHYMMLEAELADDDELRAEAKEYGDKAYADLLEEILAARREQQ